jgi:hypothetical protein
MIKYHCQNCGKEYASGLSKSMCEAQHILSKSTDPKFALLMKAARNLDYIDCYHGDKFYNGCTDLPWNPLDSDADAFQLMTELGISLFFGSRGSVLTITTILDGRRRKTEFRCGEDEPAIVRHAIVRAAAGVD